MKTRAHMGSSSIVIFSLMSVSQLSALPVQDQEEEGPTTYSDVITEETETDEGVFDVHRTEGTLLFEIPDSLLGRDMLLVS